MLAGTVASALILAANTLARANRWTDLDLPVILGLTFRRSGGPDLVMMGVAWYFMSGGVLAPTLYWLVLRRLGRAGPGLGALLGMGHLAAASALLAATEPRHPRRGWGRPMGAFLGHYGWLERAANVLAHLGYGALIGAAAAWDAGRAGRNRAARHA